MLPNHRRAVSPIPGLSDDKTISNWAVWLSMPKSADTELGSAKHERSKGIERTKPWHAPDDVPWSVLTETQLAEAYRAVVEPALRSEGRDPETDRPSYEWLSSNGFRGLTYALKEYHDTTFVTFWQETLGYADDAGYDWGIHDDETRESMQRYLEEKQADRDGGWSDTTRETRRYRLARYARSYRAKHGTDDLLAPVYDGDRETAAIDAAWETYRFMRADGLSDPTIARIHDAIWDWYDWLETRAVAAFNPVDGADRQFDWDRSHNASPVALDAEHVSALNEAAVTGRDRILVIALCAWGLRAGEVAALHEDQLHLDNEKPHIAFDERKNGPGTVAVVYGAEEVRRYCSRRDGYLFPSEQSRTGHVWASTIADWFHDLADRAGVPEKIDGEPRKPHMGRRFWYEAYSQTMDDVLKFIEGIAADQGSASGRVVLEDYMSDARVREQRRQYMQERLAAAFEGEGDGI